jgi:predicted TIM-barrel fold metal-dependent hydrolase
MEGIWRLAEELDIPMALHMGTGPRNAAYSGFPNYRADNGRPLLLENILVKHPKVRVYIMHAGWPFLDEIIALLYYHPQVYVDTGIIDWGIPIRDFHYYLKRIVDAGYGNRTMFGSDQMLWPRSIPTAIESIEKADFLTEQQKRNILYNNAARFLRLSQETIATHHNK